MEQLVYAHRGASGTAPENTLEAFDLAVRQGADGVELDVHLSRDGEMVVTHDEQVNRVSEGHGWVKDLSLRELKALHCCRTHHPAAQEHPQFSGPVHCRYRRRESEHCRPDEQEPGRIRLHHAGSGSSCFSRRGGRAEADRRCRKGPRH